MAGAQDDLPRHGKVDARCACAVGNRDLRLRALAAAGVAGIFLAVALLAVVSDSGGATPASVHFQLPQTFPLATPPQGNVTLTRFVFDVRPTTGSLPAGVAAHVLLSHPQPLASPLLVTGAATSSSTGSDYHYDGFLALINRTGGAPPGGVNPIRIVFQLAGVASPAVTVSAPVFASVTNAIGAKAPAAFCKAIVADTVKPSTVGFVDPNTSDHPLAAAQRLALAQANARLCNGGAPQIGAVNAILGPLGGGMIQATGPLAPPRLLAGFVQLDRRLARVIDGVKTGELSGDGLRKAIEGLEKEKDDLINANFNQSLFGVPANTAIIDFVVIDVELEFAHELSRRLFPPASKANIVGALEAAKQRKQELEKAFHAGGQAPANLSGSLVRLDRALARVIDGVKTGELSGDGLRKAIEGLEKEKDDLINANFNQSLFGVPANTAIIDFVVIDVELEFAHELSRRLF